MLNKLKTQIQKDFGITQQPSQTQTQQQQQPSQPSEVVTFSLAKMDQFSHEELQQVIHRYDAQVKKFKQQVVERDTKISALEARVEQVVNEQQSLEEMLNLRSEEINGLKQHVQTFSTENASLTRLVQVLEQSALESEEIEKENENLQQQLEQLQNLNKELQDGDADSVYQKKYESVVLEFDKLKSEYQQIKSSLERSNQQLSQVVLESEQLDLSLQQAETQIAKKDRLIEQLKQRQIQLLDEKETVNETIAKLTEQLQHTEQTKKQIGKSTDNVLTEHAERLRGKELVIQDLNLQLKSSTQKITSMQEKEAYYKRQIEQLQKSVYELQQEKQKSQTIFVSQQNQSQFQTQITSQDDQNSDISQLMNKLKEIQGTGALPTQSSSQGESSVEPETLTTDPVQSEKSMNLEIQQLRAEFSELQSEYLKISDQYKELQEQKQGQDQQLSQFQDQMAQKNQLIQELERRRKMGRDEVKQLLQKTPKISANIQQAGILQLRVLKKDLQQLYKDFLTTSDPNSLEKSINDMIFNVNDCISEVELSQTN